MKNLLVIFFTILLSCHLSAQCNDGYDNPYIDPNSIVISGLRYVDVFLGMSFFDQNNIPVPILKDSIYNGKTGNKDITFDIFYTNYTANASQLTDRWAKQLDNPLHLSYQITSDTLGLAYRYNGTVHNRGDNSGLQINYNIKGEGTMILISNFGTRAETVLLDISFQPGIFRIRRCPEKHRGYLEKDDSLQIIEEGEQMEE